MYEMLIKSNHLRFNRGGEEIEVNKGFLIGLWLIGARQATVPIVPHRNAAERERESE